MCQTSVNLTLCCVKHTARTDTIISRFDNINRIIHKMWGDDPFSQRNKTTKRSVRVEVGEKVGENVKDRKVGNIEDLEKIGGLRTVC